MVSAGTPVTDDPLGVAGRITAEIRSHAYIFPVVMNFPIDISAHARYMYNHQCAAKLQGIFGIGGTSYSLTLL